MTVHNIRHLFNHRPIITRSKSTSSNLWLSRQKRDPYVRFAKLENYRCRSAFKLIEINQRYPFLKAGMTVLDCGAAPGSWSEVIAQLVNANGAQPNSPQGKVFAVDRTLISPINGVTVLSGVDLLDDACLQRIGAIVNGPVDAVLSDAAPNATGSLSVDHHRIVELCIRCLQLGKSLFRPDSGVFLCKLWQGCRQRELFDLINSHFRLSRTVKPSACRKESAEIYFMGQKLIGNSPD